MRQRQFDWPGESSAAALRRTGLPDLAQKWCVACVRHGDRVDADLVRWSISKRAAAEILSCSPNGAAGAVAALVRAGAVREYRPGPRAAPIYFLRISRIADLEAERADSEQAAAGGGQPWSVVVSGGQPWSALVSPGQSDSDNTRARAHVSLRKDQEHVHVRGQVADRPGPAPAAESKTPPAPPERSESPAGHVNGDGVAAESRARVAPARSHRFNGRDEATDRAGAGIRGSSGGPGRDPKDRDWRALRAIARPWSAEAGLTGADLVAVVAEATRGDRPGPGAWILRRLWDEAVAAGWIDGTDDQLIGWLALAHHAATAPGVGSRMGLLVALTRRSARCPPGVDTSRIPQRSDNWAQAFLRTCRRPARSVAGSVAADLFRTETEALCET